MSGEVEPGSALLLPTPSTPHLEQLLLESFRGKLAKWVSSCGMPDSAACHTVAEWAGMGGSEQRTRSA